MHSKFPKILLTMGLIIIHQFISFYFLMKKAQQGLNWIIQMLISIKTQTPKIQ